MKIKKSKKEIEEEKLLKQAERRKAKREKLREYSLKRTLLVSFAIVFLIVMLVFFCNRTFFKTTYKTSKIEIDIPRLMFFIKDDGNEIVFKTYRKSKYVKNFFDNHLNNYSYYRCQGNDFFYDENSQAAIYSVEVEKGFALKTVTIKYAHGDADCLCLSGFTGKKAEEACAKK